MDSAEEKTVLAQLIVDGILIFRCFWEGGIDKDQAIDGVLDMLERIDRIRL